MSKIVLCIVIKSCRVFINTRCQIQFIYKKDKALFRNTIKQGGSLFLYVFIKDIYQFWSDALLATTIE